MSSNRVMAPNRTLKIIFIGLCLINIALANQTTNKSIQSFNQAKKILQNQIYPDHRRTFYCDCPYTGKNAIISSDKYTPKKNNKRANRVEWDRLRMRLDNRSPSGVMGIRIVWIKKESRLKAATVQERRHWNFGIWNRICITWFLLWEK